MLACIVQVQVFFHLKDYAITIDTFLLYTNLLVNVAANSFLKPKLDVNCDKL